MTSKTSKNTNFIGNDSQETKKHKFAYWLHIRNMCSIKESTKHQKNHQLLMKIHFMLCVCAHQIAQVCATLSRWSGSRTGWRRPCRTSSTSTTRRTPPSSPSCSWRPQTCAHSTPCTQRNPSVRNFVHHLLCSSTEVYVACQLKKLLARN